VSAHRNIGCTDTKTKLDSALEAAHIIEHVDFEDVFSNYPLGGIRQKILPRHSSSQSVDKINEHPYGFSGAVQGLSPEKMLC
jgi:hypothetical protein